MAATMDKPSHSRAAERAFGQRESPNHGVDGGKYGDGIVFTIAP